MVKLHQEKREGKIRNDIRRTSKRKSKIITKNQAIYNTNTGFNRSK